MIPIAEGVWAAETVENLLLVQGIKPQPSGHPAQIHVINLNSHSHRKNSDGENT
jgi:hypothetical protein